MKQHAFRFGVVAGRAESGTAWLDTARRIEGLGFSTLAVPDGIEFMPAPFSALAAAAGVTSRLRLATYVLANDFRNPVLVAKEAATLDFLSGGRFELGLGAGRPGAARDNAMLGLPFDSGAVRIDRLMAAVAVVKALLAGQHVTAAGGHYRLEDAVISPAPVQQPLPILLAGSGKRMLTYAAREADIVALGLPPDTSVSKAIEVVGWVRDAAGDRFPDIELNLNMMAVGGKMPAYLARTFGVDAEAFASSDAVSVLKGSPEAMADRLQELRETLGLSYIMVGDELVDAMAPVVARLAGK